MTGNRRFGAGSSLFGLLVVGRVVRANAASPQPKRPLHLVDFDRQIRPILYDKCFQCHGPDANERKAELRLDLKEEAFEPAESGKPAIVPGKSEESTLLKRIFS